MNTDVWMQRINPFTPAINKRIISPNNVTLESKVKVMKIKEMITNLRSYGL